MIHDRLPPEYKAVSQMQRAWDTPKIAACPDSGCARYSIKSQYPQIVMSPLFRKRGHFSSLILKKRQRNVRCKVEGKAPVRQQYAESAQLPLRLVRRDEKAGEAPGV